MLRRSSQESRSWHGMLSVHSGHVSISQREGARAVVTNTSYTALYYYYYYESKYKDALPGLSCQDFVGIFLIFKSFLGKKSKF